MLERYYRHVQMITLDATRRFGSDPVLSLFRGISMIAEGMRMFKIYYYYVPNIFISSNFFEFYC